MRIGISAIHVIPGKSGSHEPYLINLTRALSSADCPHEFIIFVNEANRHLFEVRDARFQRVVYSFALRARWLRILFEQLALPIEARRRNIDVMHYAGTACSALVRKTDVVTVHHDSITQRSSMQASRNLYYDLMLRIVRRAGLIITPTLAYGEQLADYFGYPSSKICPVHHGVSSVFKQASPAESRRARHRWGIQEDAVLSVTNTLPHKNVAALIQALEILLLDGFVDLQLVLVGYVDRTRLDRIVTSSTSNPELVHSRIRVIPFVSYEDLASIYSAAKAFAFVSQTETFGMPLVESMACGLPVVASDIPVHREVLEQAGLFVPFDSPPQIAEAIGAVMSDDILRSELVRHSLARSKHFSWDKAARATISVYERAARSAMS